MKILTKISKVIFLALFCLIAIANEAIAGRMTMHVQLDIRWPEGTKLIVEIPGYGQGIESPGVRPTKIEDIIVKLPSSYTFDIPTIIPGTYAGGGSATQIFFYHISSPGKLPIDGVFTVTNEGPHANWKFEGDPKNPERIKNRFTPVHPNGA